MAVAGRAGEGDGTGQPQRSGRTAVSARRLTTFVTGLLGLSRPCDDAGAASQGEPGPAAELDCLRGIFAPSLLKAAEARSMEVGVGADQVLIRWGVIDEEAYLRRFARHAGLILETFDDVDRADCPLADDQLQFAARHGLLPIRRDGEPVFVSAPRGHTARRIARLVARYPSLARRVRVTTTAQLNEFLERRTGNALARAAAEDLARRCPEMSAAPRPAPPHSLTTMARYVRRLAAPVALLTLMPMAVFEACSVALSLWFLLFTSLRLAGSFAPRPRPTPLRRLPDHELPVYTVVAALYREATSVAPLMAYINALDYPREKLDVKLVIEPDDLATRAAIARLGPLPHVQVIIAPEAGPRTKPKALNCALAFARGTFITVFDAEDRPEPGQLRAALDVFRDSDPDIACAQASLCIDNTADGWLPRMFTAEYAGQFDVFLQGFSHFRMPLPLGGSSNHFRTAVLREVRGWDPYNVTEDADLGFRLARHGYRSVMFPSTTYEEAPARFGAWLRQRSRWMKGWMQTWSVHMRSPRRLWRDAGPSGFFTLNILVGGSVLTALAHPLLLGEFAFRMAASTLNAGAPSFLAKPFIELYIVTIAAGYLSTAIVGLIGLARRGLLREAWILALTPLYWICLSIAAWRALYQLLTEPYRWEKTEHGLARSSRLAQQGRKPAQAAMRLRLRDNA
jgi:cellulose synthase/poly-beta-1,6-N-acetylglucosamine synthase-like glycosyltransferase